MNALRRATEGSGAQSGCLEGASAQPLPAATGTQGRTGRSIRTLSCALFLLPDRLNRGNPQFCVPASLLHVPTFLGPLLV